MRAEEGDESIKDYADEAKEAQDRVEPSLFGIRLPNILNRLTGFLRRG